ncbi:histidine kinase [Rhizobium sp. AC27/96]|uniref:histidine kinase n=1 Tax=Rhizobium TaxID=379 RepID=UPI00082906BA|nr:MULTISPECIES: histidine kinase [Rhizobium]NTF45498.1 histidine kinase [Rhizobium rhizogenes]OCJ07185.1 histidine kinase [Rhizobium sp. AC27/96]
MKKILLIAAALAAFPMLANAKTLAFPSEAPIASVTIPDNWKPQETETGIDANSPDAAIYFALDVASGDNVEKVIGDAVDFLDKNGVKIDASTRKDDDSNEVNGMKMSILNWQGTDADGPVNINLGVLSPAPNKILVLTYWGSKDDQAKHEKEVLDIIGSIKPAK